MAPILQPGAQLSVAWRARLADHLGSFTVEPIKARAGVLSDRAALAGLSSLTALTSFALPERQAYPAFYHATCDLLDLIEAGADWQAEYVGWEVELLHTLGFGMDLTRCAVTGSASDLVYVSPRSGRAVSRSGGADYADRLLPLPPFLRSDTVEDPITAQDLRDGLRLTGHFLAGSLAPSLGKDALPPARDRLVRAFDRL